ncbi:hypothetical protein F5Y15DRAFT_230885 [Xylariaceae sp. FL0016]|nr:hypothetical protein F5Y15DRAFT_230885 [Xylariaceae sp. FL0016]
MPVNNHSVAVHIIAPKLVTSHTSPAYTRGNSEISCSLSGICRLDFNLYLPLSTIGFASRDSVRGSRDPRTERPSSPISDRLAPPNALTEGSQLQRSAIAVNTIDLRQLISLAAIGSPLIDRRFAYFTRDSALISGVLQISGPSFIDAHRPSQSLLVAHKCASQKLSFNPDHRRWHLLFAPTRRRAAVTVADTSNTMILRDFP